MDETLREVIEYHVREGYELAAFAPPRATLVRGGEVVRLRLEGRWVRFEQAAEPAAGPAAVAARGAWAAGWLAFVLGGGGAAAAAAALVLIAFAVLLDDGAPSTVATPVPTLPPAPTLPTATATPTPTPMATATPTQTPPATPRATPPALITALVVRDQLLGPGSRQIVVEEAGHDAPFYVVVYAGDASTFGSPLAASALLAAGTHTHIPVPLPRLAEDGKELWVALHAEQSGNTSFDDPAVDGPLTEAATGSRGPQRQVAARIAVVVGAPAPPVSGGGAVLREPGAVSHALLALLAASAALTALSARMLTGARAL